MGTHADFYIGRDPKTMYWIGSVTHDGYPEGIVANILLSTNVHSYQGRLIELKQEYPPRSRSVVLAEEGWPHPWEPEISDYAYTFDDGIVWMSSVGGWVPCRDYDEAMTYLSNAITALEKIPGTETLVKVAEDLQERIESRLEGKHRPEFPTMIKKAT